MDIRLATPDDAPAVAAIYAPFVRHTAVSFELEPPDGAEMARRMARDGGRYPWFVLTDGDEVGGYAYAGPHRARPAYRWSIETSVYLAASAQGRGHGSALAWEVLAEAARRDFAVAYAGVTLPNDASVAMHRRVGYTDIGTFRAAGFKHGAWHDVAWFQCPVGGVWPTEPPADPAGVLA